jgi:DNA-binding NarL/FixJ family response regulator
MELPRGVRFPDMSNLKVVIVDDLAFSRNIARSLLMAADVRQMGMAATIEDGWRLIREDCPDLLILDWELAEQSGIDLLRTIRTSPDCPCPGLSVLMLTAYREEHRVREAISAGITSYLTKPYSPRDFILKVKQCVERQASLRSFTPEAAYPPEQQFVSL